MKEKESKQKKTSGLRKKAEKKLKSRTTPTEKLSDEEVRKLAHELQVHQIELEIQNEDLRTAQIVIEESRQKYSDLYDFAPVGYFTLDENGLIIEANLTCATMLGVERSLLIKKPLSNFIAREDQDKYYLYRRHVFKMNEYKACELKMFKKDGTEFYVQLECAVVQDLDGGSKKCMTVITDITERKKSEERLKASERKNRALLECSPICTKIVDLDFNLQYMSTSGIKDLKIKDITQFYGKPYPFDFYPESFRNLMTKNLEKVKETGQVITQEASVVDIEGNELWFQSTLVPVNDEENRIDYIMIVSIGTTERKQMESELRMFNESLEKLVVERTNQITKVNEVLCSEIDKHKQTENELGKSYNLLNSIIEEATDIIFVKDQSGHYILMNSAGAKTIGKPIEEIIGKDDTQLFPHDIAHKLMGEDQKTIASGKDFIFEEEIPKSGKIHIFNTAKAPYRDCGGNIIGVIGIARDITERKQMEKELDAFNRLLEQLVIDRTEELNKKSKYLELEITQRRHLEKTLKLYSRQHAAMAYLRRKAMINEDLTVLMNEVVRVVAKTLDNEYCKVLELLPDGKEFLLRAGIGWKQGLVGQAIVPNESNSQEDYTLRQKRPVVIKDLREDKRFSGAALLCEHNVISGMSVIINGHTGPWGVLSTHTMRRKAFNHKDINFLQAVANLMADVINRERTEETLRKSEERYRKLIETAKDAIVCTINGIIIVWNKSAEKIFGYLPGEIIGQPITTIIPEKYLEKYHVGINSLLKSDETRMFGKTIEVSGKTKKGNIIPIEISLSSQKNKKELYFSSAIIRDLTERRKIDRELMKMQKLESIGILAGGIAHDFNNFLTGILGNIILAKTYINTENKAYEKLVEAEKVSLSAKHLAGQLLTFAKGGKPLKGVCSVAELIKDSVPLALRGSNIKCQHSIPDDLWTVEFDKGQMIQVISNIVINAEQSMPEGGTIKIWAENIIAGNRDIYPLKAGRYIKISVQDYGVGIPKEHFQKVFDPYYTTKQQGSGLGLTTCHSIIKNHDGCITIESKMGVGTIFHVYLPASEKGKWKKDVPTRAVKKGKKEDQIVEKGRVLVMDDEQFIRDTTGELLMNVGYNVELAREGNEAIKLYKEATESGQPFDALILDLTVPGGMGGKEAIEKLIEIDPKVKTIVSSGYSNDPIMANFRKYGFSGVITKPFEIQELIKTLDKIINE